MLFNPMSGWQQPGQGPQRGIGGVGAGAGVPYGRMPQRQPMPSPQVSMPRMQSTPAQGGQGLADWGQNMQRFNNSSPMPQSAPPAPQGAALFGGGGPAQGPMPMQRSPQYQQLMSRALQNRGLLSSV